MLPLAYTESSALKEHLAQIDTLRARLLTIPLSPKTEMKFRWEARATRIHSSLTLAHTLFSRGQIVKILGSHTKHIPSDYRDVLAYDNALNYIDEYWMANQKPITVSSVLTLAMMVLPNPKDTIERAFTTVEAPMKTTLEYLENQNDHPIIQAGIALCLFSTAAGISLDSSIVARLVTSVFFAKFGYDCRGLMTVEKNWVASGNLYEDALASHQKEGNLNQWLLFFAQSIEENLLERVEDVSSSKFHQEFPASFWELSDRQRTIIRYLEEPTNSITNKKVQSMFGISQITSSRDLSKLTTLGLISSHGKGRSVSYTR
jgi:Fic family protein